MNSGIVKGRRDVLDQSLNMYWKYHVDADVPHGAVGKLYAKELFFQARISGEGDA